MAEKDCMSPKSVCVGGYSKYALYPQSYKRLYIFQFLTYIFSSDIIPEMLKLCRVTIVKAFFIVLVYNFR